MILVGGDIEKLDDQRVEISKREKCGPLDRDGKKKIKRTGFRMFHSGVEYEMTVLRDVEMGEGSRGN